jgi:hypothetical protein
MTAANSFKIEKGFFALAVVDTAAAGYLDSWQSPGGLAIDVVTLAAYTDADAQWSCQLQTGTVDPSANNNDQVTDATWCSAAVTTPNPGETSWAINGTYVSDVIDAAGLWAFLYLHDTDECYWYMGLGGESSAPAAMGKCRVIGSTFGGAGYTVLTSTLGPLPVSRRFDAWNGAPGTAGKVIEGLTNTVRPGVPTVLAASASAGKGGNGKPADKAA